MKVLVLLLAVAACRADNCDNSFGDFLNNLKSGIDKNAQALQQEIKDDEATLAKKCFDDSTSGSKCALTDDELHTDCFGDSGPMKGCDRCIKLSGSLRDKFLKSDPNTRKCFRQHLGKAIKEELEPCIQGKISNGYSFRVPDLPDFEEKTFDYIDLVLQGISEDVMIHSRLDACQNVNPAKFAISGPCVDNGYAGIYSKHCQVAKDAKAKAVSSACLARFNEVKTATCQCMVEKKQDWHQRFDKIKTIVDDTAAQSIEASACGDQINNIVGTWLSKLQSALNDCLPSASSTQKTDLHTLINLGCGQVHDGGVKKNELTVGFRFIRLFLDALNNRIIRFCDKNCAA